MTVDLFREMYIWSHYIVQYLRDKIEPGNTPDFPLQEHRI